MKVSLVVLSLILLSACVPKSGQRKKIKSQKKEAVTVKVNAKETYLAILRPVNEAVDSISGSYTIDVEGDILIANGRVSNSSPTTVHAQAIHVGSFCPNEIADENQDGYIDVNEAQPYISPVLIPLDGDLNSQDAQAGFYPTTDAWGSYIYSMITSYRTMLDDLYAEDPNPHDDIVKLKNGLPLNLADKVIVIYGVSDSFVLPETVATLPGLTSNQTLPIACGTFVKIEGMPGTQERDDVTVGRIGSPPGTSPANPGRTIPPRTAPSRPDTSSNPDVICPRGKNCD